LNRLIFANYSERSLLRCKSRYVDISGCS